MIPDGGLSTIAYFAPFAFPVRSPGEYLKDYELAGVALRDGTRGMQVKTWTVYVMQTSQVWMSAPGVAPILAFDRGVNIQEVAIAFDNNMNPFIAFREGVIGTAGSSFIWWYDSTDSTQKFTALPAGIVNPRACVDEHRPSQTSVTDVVLAYIRGGSLYALYQRERYTVEHLLQSGLGSSAELISVSMNRAWRLQWRLRNALEVAGAAVFETPFLGDVVKEMTYWVGIGRQSVNVAELYDEHVYGYLVASTEGLSKSLEPLSKAFNFDPSEYDRMLHYTRRGRDVVFQFTFDDLASPMKQTRQDETKLPIRVDVNHIDPDGGFAKNKQTAYRKSNLVSAKGSETLDFAFSMTADQAASAGLQYIKKKWHELMTYEWSLPIGFTFATGGDVCMYYDEDGSAHRIRIEERNESDGLLEFKGSLDGGPDVYNRGTTGSPLPPPLSTTPGLVGETRLEIINLSPLRDQDDELGVYIGVAGASSAWYGASVEMSTNGGVNFVDATQTEIPATLGDTETELLPEVSPEYPSNQTVIVKVNFALESTNYEELLKNFNRAIIGDELIQFQTALHLGDNRFLLSGLIRGRYNTQPEGWPVGTRFVLIDTSLIFLQAQQWMLHKEVQFKAISYGTDGEDAVPVAYDYDIGASQIEWPPHHVVATRDISNNVKVDWIGRGRLGIETVPRNGKYFTGYNIKFSDGFNATVGPTVTTYTRASTPAGVTVQVCGTNSITGDGDYSKATAT